MNVAMRGGSEGRLFDYETVRRPRARLVVGGQAVAGVVSARVTSNNYYAADTWSATLALGPDPERAADFWGTQDEVECEVLFGFVPPGRPEGEADWRSLLVGTADRVEIDEDEGLVYLDGRDFTAKLQGAQVIETFQNLKASDIARRFAAEHGLAAEVEETPGLVGSFFDDAHAAASTGEFTSATDQWSYLSFLAQQYPEFNVWVRGRTLHFKRQTVTGAEPPFVLRYQRGPVDRLPAATVRGVPTFNATSLRVERDLTRARDIEVLVRSWRGSEARQFEVVARRDTASIRRERQERGKASGGLFAEIPKTPGILDSLFPDDKAKAAQNERTPARQTGVHRYVIERPGLTHEQALSLAEAKLREASLHERKFAATTPGELDLEPRHRVRLTGHSTGWDQDYYVDSIERSLSMDGGFVQTLTCRNESPGGTTVIATG